MKTPGSYNIFILFLIGISLLVWFQSRAPQPINWTPTFYSKDHIPFGTKVLYEQIHQIFPESQITHITSSLYMANRENLPVDANYLFMSQNFTTDSLDSDVLLKLAHSGAQIFIAANQFGYHLTDTLGFSTETDFFGFTQQADTNYLSFINQTEVYPYARTNSFYFSDFDSNTTTVLGYKDYSQPNFLRINYGKGAFYLHSHPVVFTNYHLLYAENPYYAFRVLSHLPANRSLVWDSYYKPAFQQTRTPLRYILLQPALKWSYYIIILSLILYVLVNARREQRVIPVVRPFRNASLDFVITVANLYFFRKDNHSIAAKSLRYFQTYLHDRYHLTFEDIKLGKIDLIAAKTHKNKQLIRSLFDFWKMHLQSRTINDEQLVYLNRKLELFYTKTD